LRRVVTVRQFLEEVLIDTIHVSVAPIENGRERLLTHEDLLDRFHLEPVHSPSGVTHLLFWRR
jgi:hypothetical protein